MLIKDLKELLVLAKKLGTAWPLGDPGIYWDPKIHAFQATNLVGGDLRQFCTDKMPSESFVLPLAAVNTFRRSCKGPDSLQFLQDKGVTLRCGSLEMSLPHDICHPPEEGGGEYIKPQADINFSPKGCFYAAAKEEDRTHIHGMLLEISGNKQQMVCTDGHRLAIVGDLFLEEPTQFFFIPYTVADVLAKLPTPIIWGLGKHNAVFVSGATAVQCKEAEGRFAPWRQVWPKKTHDFEIKVNRKLFYNALKGKKDSVLIKGHNKWLRTMDTLVVTRDLPSHIDARIHGTFLGFSMDPLYLNEFLTKTKTDEVSIKGRGPEDALIFNDSTLIMPMRS